MTIDRQQIERLKARYKTISTEQLIEISLKELTPEAKDVLETELKTRAHEMPHLEEYKQELITRNKKVAKANNRLASRSKRLLAKIIDFLIAFAFLLLANYGYWGQIAGYSLFVFYIFFADGLLGGQSIGKFLLKIRVIVMKNGQPCDYLRSCLRNFLLVLMSPFDWLFILSNDKRRIGDRAAGTIVVNSILL